MFTLPSSGDAVAEVEDHMVAGRCSGAALDSEPVVLHTVVDHDDRTRCARKHRQLPHPVVGVLATVTAVGAPVATDDEVEGVTLVGREHSSTLQASS